MFVIDRSLYLSPEVVGEPGLRPLVEDPGSLNRLRLIALLRDPAQWPIGFVWNYGDCSSCAIGLLCATKLIPAHPAVANSEVAEEDEFGHIARYLGLTAHQVKAIFWRADAAYNSTFPTKGVTALRVADLIEATIPRARKLLAEREK